MAECYKEFVCVENARFSTPVKLAAGKDWNATTVMDVVDLK
jgi:D-hexose-6-phosphate mutarotase